MSRFLSRRAEALVEEAERLKAEGSEPRALERLFVARDLLHGCRGSLFALPPLLRRIGNLSAALGNDELSDQSFLDAHRLEIENARLEQRLRAESGLPPGAQWSRLDTTRWSVTARAKAEALRSGLHTPMHHLVVHGGEGRGAGKLVAALGSEWVARGISVIFRSGRGLVEDLQRAHREHDSESILRSYDIFGVVAVNEPEHEDQDALRCLEHFVADRSSRGSLVISCGDLRTDPIYNGRDTALGDATSGWLHLLRAGGKTLLLDLGWRKSRR